MARKQLDEGAAPRGKVAASGGSLKVLIGVLLLLLAGAAGAWAFGLFSTGKEAEPTTPLEPTHSGGRGQVPGAK